MNGLALPKLNLGLETMRALNRAAYRVMGLFVNLEAAEKATLNSRLIEYPFVIRKLYGLPPGQALDVGCADGGNVLAPILASLGWQVYGIDIREFRLPYPSFHFVRADMAKGTEFSDGFFDCVYAVSSIEHFGLAGRYGVKEDDSQADFKAVRETKRVLKPGAPFLLTVPYGSGGVVRPSERVYGRGRLSQLLADWSIRDEAYWYLDNAGDWHEVSEEEAGRTRTPGGVAIALLELTCA
jgi:SAM-dependent methyltransferase